MTSPRKDPSIEHEPHLLGDAFAPDESEAKAARIVGRAAARQSESDRVEHTVWDEPGRSAEITGDAPPEELTFGRWLLRQRALTPASKTWLVTLAAILLAGPWGVLGAFWGTPKSGLGGILVVSIFAPVVEEMMKIGTALLIVEKRPYLFRSPMQIALVALAGGLAFSVIENLIYLHVYVPHHDADFARWRWTVCVALHTTCSFVAGLGLVHVWRDCWRRLARPRLSLLFPYWAAAAIIHGLYNATVTIYSLVGRGF